MQQVINTNLIPEEEEAVKDARVGAQSTDLHLTASETLDAGRRDLRQRWLTETAAELQAKMKTTKKRVNKTGCDIYPEL